MVLAPAATGRGYFNVPSLTPVTPGRGIGSTVNVIWADLPRS